MRNNYLALWKINWYFKARWLQFPSRNIQLGLGFIFWIWEFPKIDYPLTYRKIQLGWRLPKLVCAAQNSIEPMLLERNKPFPIVFVIRSKVAEICLRSKLRRSDKVNCVPLFCQFERRSADRSFVHLVPSSSKLFVHQGAIVTVYFLRIVEKYPLENWSFHIHQCPICIWDITISFLFFIEVLITFMII